MNLLVPAFGAAALILTGCAPVEAPQNPPPLNPPHTISPDAGQCRAADYEYLIGRSRSQIPPQPAGANWRVTCTSCPVTMDYNPGRLNIFYEERSGVVREVRCG